MTEDWNWKPNLPGLLQVLKLVSWRHIPHRIKELNSAECISFSLFSADYDSWSQQIFWQWNIITHVKVGVWTHFHSYSLQPDYLNIWHLIYRHSACLWTHLMHILGMLLCCSMVKGKTSHQVFYLTELGWVMNGVGYGVYEASYSYYACIQSPSCFMLPAYSSWFTTSEKSKYFSIYQFKNGCYCKSLCNHNNWMFQVRATWQSLWTLNGWVRVGSKPIKTWPFVWHRHLDKRKTYTKHA